MIELSLSYEVGTKQRNVAAKRAVLKDRLASGTRWLAFDDDIVGYRVEKGDTLNWLDGKPILIMGEHGSIHIHNTDLKFPIVREAFGYDDLIIFDILSGQIGRQTVRE